MAKRGVKVRGRTYQQRKVRASSGFTKAERDRVNELLRTGTTYADAAAEIGMSYSSFNRIKKGEARLGRRLREKFVESSDYTLKRSARADRIGWEDEQIGPNQYSAGLETLLRINDPSNPFRPPTADETYAEADSLRRSMMQQAIEDGWGEYGTGEHLEPRPTWEEFRYQGATIQRPTVTKQIRTADGSEIDISYKLGRGKSDEQRAYIEQQLLDQGIDPEELDEYYDEATGYGGGGEQ